MKHYLIILLLLIPSFGYTQLNEDFTDGNFSLNPVWTGSNSGTDFIISDKQLRSNSTLPGSSFYLSTENTLALNTIWEFWVNLQFSTSGSNFTDIYLISDKADLKSTLINGYFVRIGNTEDEISLYKRSGSLAGITKIIDGLNGSVASANNMVKIRVSRNATGLFKLEREVLTGNSAYFTEGTATELSFTTSAYFGIFIQQSTASFFQKHFFDGFKIEPIVTDTIPPALKSVVALDSTNVEITFSEAMDSLSIKSVSNLSLDHNARIVKILTTTDPVKFRIKLLSGLNTAIYTLSVINVKDLNGNLIRSNNTSSFSFIRPYIPKHGDIIINEIFPDPSPQIDLPSVEFAELRNNSGQALSLKNWKFTDSGTSSVLNDIIIEPQALLILCAKADTAEFKQFGKVLGLSPWPSLNNAGDIVRLISPENLLIDSINYSDNWYQSSTKKSGGWTLERIDPKSKCGGIFNWIASKDTSGGTPGKENSVSISGYDQITLKADSLKQSSDSTIKVYFNKHLNSSTLIAENFSLSPASGAVRKIVPDLGYKEVIIGYTQKFLSGTEYSLTLSNLKDCSETVISNLNNKLHFKTGKLQAPIPERKDTSRIMITEIFADPSPEVKLPLIEFIELFNPSQDTVNLDKWTISDAVTKTIISNQKILPLEYLILCPAADTVYYKSFGRTIGISPWPSLGNSADQIVLKSFKNRIVDSIAYYDTWYHSISKKQGGWSIEKIDLKSVCEDFFNWAASKDTSGGTPGKQNSVYFSGYDQLALTADRLIQTSDTTIKVNFNKHLNGSTIIADNFNLTPYTGTVKKIISDVEFKEITLTYENKFRAGTEHLLSISKLKDCSGSFINSLKNKLTFKTSSLPLPVPERADTSRLFITEIFADPSPEIGLPLAEFIEIFNPSKDTLNLDKWTISDPTTKSLIVNQKILPLEYLILCPSADTTHYKHFGKTIGLNPWPSLNNSSDKIMLKSFKNRTVDSIAYSDSWYHNTAKQQGGWSIEKIDLKSVCEGFFNWTASKDTSGGTPGKQNSVHLSGYDQLSLKADSLKQTSDTTMKVYFNKHLNISTLLPQNFNLNPSTASVKKIICDVEFKEISITYDQMLKSGIDYILTVSNIKDCSGSAISNTNNRLAFKSLKTPITIPERIDTAKIVITEIFADPSPEVGLPLAEFIEIFNPGSDTVNLNKWYLSDASTKSLITNSTIAPGEFLILCPIADTLMFKTFGKTKGLSPWPSLGNNNDQITIKSFKQRLVDSISYSDRWYKNPVKRNGGWSLEKIDLMNNLCNDFYNWASSINASGGTPGSINSFNKPGYANQPLKIDSISYTSDSTIILYMNSIADTSYIKPSDFNLNKGLVRARSVSMDKSYKRIYLTFDFKFQEGTDYILTADSIFNCSGKLIVSPFNQASFSIPHIPEIEYPLVINEIFADPSPAVGLPETEFVELFNPTEKPVSLKGMIYGDENTEHKFNSGIIPAGSYLILCQEKDTLSFKAFGNVIGLPLWRSLSNDKGVLILKNNKGRVIHKVAYSSAWYKDTEKKKGGFSLEMIDPASICSGFQNWKASNDPSGGSPGKQNSIYKNNSSSEPLKLVEAVLTDSITLSLTFNKTIDSLSASASGNFSINNGIGEPVSVTPLAPEFDKVILKFRNALARGNTYRVDAKNIIDCKGSQISLEFNSREFILTERIRPNDILISEILFNPRPDGADFIEIYNNTKHDLDLQELYLATKLKDTISSLKHISKPQLLMRPGHYWVISSDPENIKKEYRIENPDRFLKITSLPSFSDDLGTAVLVSKNLIIDQFSYNEKMHFSLIKNFEGISLERSSFKLNANETGNFRSATSASGFATPGYKNSQQSQDPVGNEEFALTSKTFSPDNDGFEDLLQVSYHFGKPGMIANVTIYNDEGIQIKKLLKNYTLNSEGVFTWDGLNEFNSIPGTGIYIIQAEIFDTSGNVKRFRKSFVLAVKL